MSELHGSRKMPDFVSSSEQENRRKKRLKFLYSGLSVFLIFLLGAGIYALARSGSNDPSTDTKDHVGAKLTPKNVNANGAMHILPDGSSNSSVTADKSKKMVTMYFDPQCPSCGLVDRAMSSNFQNLMKQGKIDMYMNPLAFLNASSSDNYSERAVNAIMTVNEKDPKDTYKFITALYKEGTQPKEAAEYVSVNDSKLAKTAESVGVPSAVANTFKNHDYVTWVINHTDKMSQDKATFPQGLATPTILVGGTTNAQGIPTGYTKAEFSNNESIETTFMNTLNSVKN